MLIGLGEDHGSKIAEGFPPGSGIPFVKIWDLDQPSPEGGYTIICRHELYQGLHVNKVLHVKSSPGTSILHIIVILQL